MIHRSLRHEWLVRLIPAALLTCVVALLNQFPLTYPDSGNYLENAYSLAHWQRPWFFFRPLTYGAFLVPFSVPGALWLIPVTQGFLSAWAVDLCLRAAALRLSTRAFIALFAGLSVFTSLAWFSGQIMPDIFTSLVVLLCFVSVWGDDRLTRAERWAAGSLLTLAIGSHLSHLPLYGLLAAAALAWRVVIDRPSRSGRRLGRLVLRVMAPLVTAAGLLIGLNWYFHREPVLSRSSGLFALAHLVGDSLAQRYLDRTCSSEHYLLCDERASLRADVDWFLWATDGTRERHEAALERGDSTFLHEAPAIVTGTLRQEWRAAIAAALRGATRQLGTFGLHRGELAFSSSVERALARSDPAAARAYRASRQVRGTWPVGPISIVHQVAVAVGLLALLWSLPAIRGPTHGPLRRLVAIVFLGVVLNAVVMASLARVHPRYQSRVVWLVPLMGAAVTLHLLGARPRPDSAVPSA